MLDRVRLIYVLATVCGFGILFMSLQLVASENGPNWLQVTNRRLDDELVFKIVSELSGKSDQRAKEINKAIVAAFHESAEQQLKKQQELSENEMTIDKSVFESVNAQTQVIDLQKELREKERQVKDLEDKLTRKRHQEISDSERELRQPYHDELNSEYYTLAREERDKMMPLEFSPEDYVDGKIEPSGEKIVIITACDDNERKNNETRHQQVLDNRQEYTSKHGYKHQFVDTAEFRRQGDTVAWGKVPAIRKAMRQNPDAEWFWWLDTDALIMNMTVSLAEHVLNPKVLQKRLTYKRPLRDEFYLFSARYMREEDVKIDEVDLIFSQDGMGLNAGSLIFRNSPFIHWLLDIWDDRLMRDIDWWQAEQSALAHLVVRHPTILKHVGPIPQALINAYYNEAWQWEHGDFVLHFAGTVKRGSDYPAIWQEKIDTVVHD